MCVPFLPVFLLKDLGVSPDNVSFWSGLVYSITFFFAAMMAPYWGAMADKVGQKRMAIRAGIGLVVTYVMSAMCQDEYQFLVIRGLIGLISGFVPASMSLVSSTLPVDKMGWGMGLMQTALSSGGILGPLIGGYLSSWFGIRASFWLSSVCLTISTLLVIFLVRDVSISEERRNKKVDLISDLREALKNKGILYTMMMFFLIQVCIMLLQPLITIYVGQLMGKVDDETIQMAGIIFSLAGISGIMAAPFWGKRGQQYGYVKTFCYITLGAGVVNLFKFFTIDVYQFAVVQFVYGLFLAGAIPNINANLAEVTDQSIRGKAFGLVTSAQMSGGFVGPLLGGALGHFLPTRLVIICAGIILIAMSGYTYTTKVKAKTL
ncbi:MAG: MFS transporter [Phascolarctobacterium sp.]|nr:MFS transporter [Phascolarctobacterium sp.]